jgi:hypothetical protein
MSMHDALFVLATGLFLIFWISGLVSIGVANEWKDYFFKLKNAGWTETADGRLVPLSILEVENIPDSKNLRQTLSWEMSGVDSGQFFGRMVSGVPLFLKLRRRSKNQKRIYTREQNEFLENLRLGLIDPPDLASELRRRFSRDKEGPLSSH